jgi:hypothetical protein
LQTFLLGMKKQGNFSSAPGKPSSFDDASVLQEVHDVINKLNVSQLTNDILTIAIWQTELEDQIFLATAGCRSAEYHNGAGEERSTSAH